MQPSVAEDKNCGEHKWVGLVVEDGETWELICDSDSTHFEGVFVTNNSISP